MSDPSAPRPTPTPTQALQRPTSTMAKAPTVRQLINFNSPKAIFLAWTGLIFIAGYGYYTVKTNNTQKKKDLMIKQGQASAVTAGTTEVGTAVQPGYTPGNNEKFHQSPLQSLTSAFTRQTDQRLRTRD